LTTTASPPEGGTIVCDPVGYGDPWYDSLTVVELTANANGGYTFNNWSGDLTGTTNPQSLTMDAPKSVTANFSSGVPAPVAEFSADKRSASGYTGDTSLTVNFTDESTGTVTSWEWDFDNDGSVDSTDQNPSYTYSGFTGKKTVKLTVTGPGGSDSEIKTDYIRIIPAANRIYVAVKTGNDTDSGATWALAKKTIQAGINAAGNDYAVLVAKGTYSTVGNYNLDFGGKAIHLKGVTAGATDDSGTIWRIDGSNTSGRRGFIFQTSETALTVVDNFEIYRGNAASSEVGGDVGGGIYASGASPTIVNCTIWSCRGTDGGGICCENGSNLTITGCTLKSNAATDGDGGGIYCYGSSPRIMGCTIGVAGSANTAAGTGGGNGGGLCCFNNSNPRVTGCTFDSNSVSWAGGAIACVNGSSPKIINCQILSNVGSDHGGGVCLDTNSNATITGCTIAGNTTDWYGAGMYIESSTPTISGCTIGGDLGANAAGAGGGGIYFWSSSSTIINCVIKGNSAVAFAGGIECDVASSPQITNCLITGNSTTADPVTNDGNGAGIDVYGGSNATFSNCTIVANSASRSGGGIYSSVSNPVLNNTIVWGNTAGVAGNQICTWNSLSYATLNYSDYANGANDVAGPGTVTPTNCIVSDPLFMDAGSGDYHLQATSPCKDTGSNALAAGITTDLEGNPRIYNSTVDMGAYEYQPPP
jgi:PKD repeat protein